MRPQRALADASPGSASGAGTNRPGSATNDAYLPDAPLGGRFGPQPHGGQSSEKENDLDG